MTCSYSDPDPARAQRIANAYADAFVASNLDKRFQANASAKVFLEDKIAQLKIKLEDSEKKMLEFAKKEQIVDVNEKSSIAESNLAAANAALGNLIADRIKNEQLWKQVEGAGEINLPQLLTNSVIARLREQRKALEVEYQEKLETFKPSYPAMVQISNKIEGDRRADRRGGQSHQGVTQSRLRNLLRARARNQAAHRDFAERCSRATGPEHPVQHS